MALKPLGAQPHGGQDTKKKSGYTVTELRPALRKGSNLDFLKFYSGSCPVTYRSDGCRQKSLLDGVTDLLAKSLQHITTASFV